jgi:iron complex transport system ATP-binding protein
MRMGQESGVSGQESGIRNQESGVRGQGSVVSSQVGGDRGQESGVSSQVAGGRAGESGAGIVAIEMRGVSAGYRKHDVLREISLCVEQGQMAAVIGPNGAGKTTMLKTLTGLLKISQGSLQLCGRDLSSLSPVERAAMIGVVPQGLDVPMALTVEEVVMTGRAALIPRWSGPRRVDRRAVERAMALSDVIDLRSRLVTQLSSGETQRVLVAMVLAQGPRIMLLDEATSHLDINHRLEVMQVVQRLNRDEGITVLMVSHDLNLAADYCERLFLLKDGELLASGEPREVLTEELLRQAYRCSVHVETSAGSGHVRVTPIEDHAIELSGEGLHIHVVGGGGSCEWLLRRLVLGGYRVTAGVLNEGDSDAVVAQALGLEVVLERPFSNIGAEAAEQAAQLVADAAATIVVDVPFGPGNVQNLALCQRALTCGKQVLLADGIAARDFTGDDSASGYDQQLRAAGATGWCDRDALLTALPQRLPPPTPLKRRFDFRLGTTSYIVPAPLVANCRVLARYVDDIELLLFEADEVSNMPSPEEIAELRDLAEEHDLSYTIHLPMDTWLGDADAAIREASLAKCRRVMALCEPLAPFAYVLHCHADRERSREEAPSADMARWLANHRRSIAALLESGIAAHRIAVETLAYPFAPVAALVRELGLSVCLDVGHLLVGGHDLEQHIEELMPMTRVVHLHGVAGGHDHKGLSHWDRAQLRSLLSAAAGERVVTVEVFDEGDWVESMQILDEESACQP